MVCDPNIPECLLKVDSDRRKLNQYQRCDSEYYSRTNDYLRGRVSSVQHRNAIAAVICNPHRHLWLTRSMDSKRFWRYKTLSRRMLEKEAALVWTIFIRSPRNRMSKFQENYHFTDRFDQRKGCPICAPLHDISSPVWHVRAELSGFSDHDGTMWLSESGLTFPIKNYLNSANDILA